MQGSVPGALPPLSPVRYCKASTVPVHRWENDDSAKLSNWPVTRSESGKGEASLGTRVSLATQNWFCPVLSWESADPSRRARRGAGSMNLTPTQRATHWGPRAALGTSDMIGKLPVPSGWKRFSSLPPDSQRCVWIRNSKNKAEQPLRERLLREIFLHVNSLRGKSFGNY